MKKPFKIFVGALFISILPMFIAQPASATRIRATKYKRNHHATVNVNININTNSADVMPELVPVEAINKCCMLILCKTPDLCTSCMEVRKVMETLDYLKVVDKEGKTYIILEQKYKNRFYRDMVSKLFELYCNDKWDIEKVCHLKKY